MQYAGCDERSTSNDAGRQFSEWASLFSARVFVKIVLYADESGTHDPTGMARGAECPVIGGYLAYRDDWIRFCGEWDAVLKNYTVPYFHFREFNDRDAAQNDNSSPYHGWDKNRRESFLYDLAEVAGKQIPVGGMYFLKKHNEVFPNDSQYPYIYTFRKFFECLDEMLKERPYLSEKIAIFMDRNSDKEWKHALIGIVDEYRKKVLDLMTKLALLTKKCIPIGRYKLPI
jgi:hypothetical protein